MQNFPGSALLTFDTVGVRFTYSTKGYELTAVQHASIAATSTCVNSYMRAYFRNGTLPKPGTVCQPDGSLFQAPNTTTTVQRRELGTATRRWRHPFMRI